MSEISILAIDLAKNSFQVCCVKVDGVAVFNKSVSRSRLIQLFSDHTPCIVAMEACAMSHYWGRMAQAHGHEVRIIPAIYVKPFVKRQKNDFADAAAIAEAASRPSMSFVAVKSAEKQARAVAFRTHQCFVRQRTQLINALRGHLAEFGLVAPKGPVHLKLLQAALNGPQLDLPTTVREMGQLYVRQIRYASTGSSPRVRGTEVSGRRPHGHIRFIPARAGNRRAVGPMACVHTVHPRACGEQAGNILAMFCGRGSSPRVRGTDHAQHHHQPLKRFIPARAGNRAQGQARSTAPPVHPRACGEQ